MVEAFAGRRGLLPRGPTVAPEGRFVKIEDDPLCERHLLCRVSGPKIQFDRLGGAERKQRKSSEMADVDVLLPIRNPNPQWLHDSLASVENQVGVNARLVAVLHPDDDHLREQIQRMKVSNVVISAPREGNLADALNVGLGECVTALVARMDADDICEPTRLVRQCEFMDNNPDCGVLASSVTIIDASGRRIGTRPAPSSPDSLERLMRWKCAIMHPSVMFRRQLVLSLGGYSAAAEQAEDYELWLRVLAHSEIEALAEPLVSYRVHQGQQSVSKAIPRDASATVLRSRLELATARGDSLFAARSRHAVWNARQGIRRVKRPH